MRRVMLTVAAILLVTFPSEARSGHAIARSAKFVATLSPAKAAKLLAKGVSFPERHPKRFAKAIF